MSLLYSIDKVKLQWILLKSNRVFVSSVSKISIELIDLTLIICLKAFWFVYDSMLNGGWSHGIVAKTMSPPVELKLETPKLYDLIEILLTPNKFNG